MRRTRGSSPGPDVPGDGAADNDATASDAPRAATATATQDRDDAAEVDIDGDGAGFDDGSAGMSTRPEEPVLPRLTLLETLRWGWRQLTSMRVALVLLFLLALAAVPGSLIPQVGGANPTAVAEFHVNHPGLSSFYDKLQLFDVFGSVWFAAIYILLFISLVGCIVPRSWAHYKAMRARPPAAPRNLRRMPTHRSYTTDAPVDEAVAEAARLLKGRRFRSARGDGWVAGEKGYLRETGNLLFHVSLLLVLVAIAYGKLYGYTGNVIVVEGSGYSDTVSQLDDYHGGRLFSANNLPPYSISLDKFNAQYQSSGQQMGAPREYDAELTVRDTPTSTPRAIDLQVNHPLSFGSTQVFLGAHGYAPMFTVRDGSGQVVFQGPTVFLPQDSNDTSTGVVKVPDAHPQQLGFSAFFFPTATEDPRNGFTSVFPSAVNPMVTVTAFYGDLGLDSGVPQNVYSLNTSGLTQVKNADGTPVSQALAPNGTMALPNGLGSITFDGYKQWVQFTINADPGKPYVLGAAAAAVLGLLLSLRIRRRRVWVRAGAAPGGGTLVEIAGLSRTENGRLEADVERITDGLLARIPARPEPEERTDEGAEPADSAGDDTADEPADDRADDAAENKADEHTNAGGAR